MYGGDQLWQGALLGPGHQTDQILLKYSPGLSEYLHKFRPLHLDTSLSRNSKFAISSDRVSSSGSVSLTALQSEHKFKVPFPPQSGAKLISRLKYQQLFPDNHIKDKFVISEEDKETDCQAKEDHHDLQHLQDTGEVLENLGRTFITFILSSRAWELNMNRF